MKAKIVFYLFLLIAMLFLQLLGLMKIIPVYISSPLLFITLFFFLYHFNQRNRFKGF
ncbi:hypothetical protein [Peribacillus cavernae]|uniref:hypothetical protein n=1 Tax=Peribacillus cavernae TaxID=1674310 RepID=UPI00163C04AA|nr:hypothetical protein [Peribacillus cavernae]MDQ0217514.1 hypothetical protein [Peribacillus cavernae]